MVSKFTPRHVFFLGLFLKEGGDITQHLPCKRVRADYPEARLDLAAVTCGSRLEYSEGLAQGSVGVEPTKTYGHLGTVQAPPHLMSFGSHYSTAQARQRSPEIVMTGTALFLYTRRYHGSVPLPAQHDLVL